MTTTGRDAASAAVDATAPLLDEQHAATRVYETEQQQIRQQQQQQLQPLDGFLVKLQFILNLLFVTLPILIFVDGLRLFLFVIFLTPAFAQFVWYYFVTSHRIVRRYSPNSCCRTTLDIYGATTTATTTTSDDNDNDDDGDNNKTSNKPVLVLFPGGAWMIGYKMWGTLLAKAMASQYLVVICDYRNYSIVGGGATVPAMIQDVHDAIAWTFTNCESFGGDSSKIFLVGQSAGGHLCACVLLRKVLEQLRQRQQQQEQAGDDTNHPASALAESSSLHHDSNNDFNPTDLAGFVSLSAPFHLEVMQKTFARHGLGGYCDQGLIDRMFGFKRKDYDPQVLLTQCCDLALQEHQSNNNNNSQQHQQQQQSLEQHHHHFVSHYLPPIAIFHGTADKTVPYQTSCTFYRTLARLPQQDDGDEEQQPPPHTKLPSSSSTTTPSSVQLHLYTGWSHTDPILEGLFDGDHRFHLDLNRLVQEWTTTAETKSQDPATTSNGIIPTVTDDKENEPSPRDSLPSLDSLEDILKQQPRMCPHFLVTAARWVNPF